ncbi:hypothetical protein APHAL10511_001317 [Amanita phalloides]|nr:hypothetical protein APHAL10511_001317 [Amanita phalloides]
MDLSAASAAWRKALDELPATPNNIPAFFFSHGSPRLLFGGANDYMGPNGPLATFLADFGPALLQKYKPKGIVVFSAHWETEGERLVSDYGDENPLLMDYYNFPSELYEVQFKSRGDAELSRRVVELFNSAGERARTTPITEARGVDGRGFKGPGLDHGVFVPFRLMFGAEFSEIPIVQVSIDSSMSPERNWAVGKAVAPLREEGILILAGGLTFHNLQDRAGFTASTAKAIYREFDEAIVGAIGIWDAEERKRAMMRLTEHKGFRAAHPREDHFVPLYVAGGAGEAGGAGVVSGVYGTATVGFGL